MPLYRFDMWRTVTEIEKVKREIEAPTQEAAQVLADSMAVEFNSDCPDDVDGGGSVECGDWQADCEDVA